MECDSDSPARFSYFPKDRSIFYESAVSRRPLDGARWRNPVLWPNATMGQRETESTEGTEGLRDSQRQPEIDRDGRTGLLAGGWLARPRGDGRR